MLQNLKENKSDTEDIYKINYVNGYIKALYISQHLKHIPFQYFFP